MMKEVYIIEFNSFEEMLDFLEWLMNDDAQEAWATEKKRRRMTRLKLHSLQKY